MPKNPGVSARVKRNGPMNGAMKFFLAGCVAELYLLIIRRFYVNGTLQQVVSWDSYLKYVLWAGVAVLAVGLVLALVWRHTRKKQIAGWSIFAAGAFLVLSAFTIRKFYDSALTLLCVVVLVAMLLGILWSLYDRECAWSLTALGGAIILLWVCRRGLSNMYLSTYVKVAVVIYLVLLVALIVLARVADRKDGLVGKLRMLPAGADPLPIYVSSGLSAVALVIALFSTTIAYYAIWALALVAFALAVYYTVKQL